MENEKLKEERKEEVFQKLKAVPSGETVFSKIMYADSVQELLDLNIGPEELVPIFKAAELFARELDSQKKVEDFGNRIKRVRADRKRQRTFFI